MSKLNQYLEAAKENKQAKKEWWKKNAKALINWCDDDPDGAIETYWDATGGGDDEEYEEFMTAERDSSAKHKAENLLDTLSIKELNGLIKKVSPTYALLKHINNKE